MGDENKAKTYEKLEELNPPPYVAGGEIQGGQSSDNVGSSGNCGTIHPANNSSQNWQNNYQFSWPYVNQRFNYGRIHTGDIPPGAVPGSVANMQSGQPIQMLSYPPPPPGPTAMMDDQWRQGLFSCFDNSGICLATWMCWEFTYFFIAYYSKRTAFWFGSFCLMMVAIFFHLAHYFSAANGDWGSFVFIILWLLTLTTVLLRVALLIFFRHRIRKDYNIKGHVAEDALVTCCCGLCSMCQMMSEVDHQMLKTGRRTVFTRS